MHIVRKIFVVLIIILPFVSWSGCKKQAKCGCGKDVLFTRDSLLINRSSIIYSEGGATAYFQDGYSTYYFCNPGEMYPVFNELSSENQLYLSGEVFWECNYLMNSSSSYYYQYYKVYNIQVTAMVPNVYGKK